MNKGAGGTRTVPSLDAKGAFDNLDHDLLMKAVRSQIKDRWMQKSHPHCPFARYADDAVVHCHSQAEAERLLAEIGERLAQCKLQMHPEKSKVVYCKNSNRPLEYPRIQFTFLGFTFRPRGARSKTGGLFTGFLPAVSREAVLRMLRTIKSCRLQRQTPGTIEELSLRYTPILRGWWNNYGSFYQSALDRVYYQVDRKLARWCRRKYKRFAGHRQRCLVAREAGATSPGVVYPLAEARSSQRLDDGSRMTRECHVRFCKRLGAKLLRPTYLQFRNCSGYPA